MRRPQLSWQSCAIVGEPVSTAPPVSWASIYCLPLLLYCLRAGCQEQRAVCSEPSLRSPLSGVRSHLQSQILVFIASPTSPKPRKGIKHLSDLCSAVFCEPWLDIRRGNKRGRTTPGMPLRSFPRRAPCSVLLTTLGPTGGRVYIYILRPLLGSCARLLSSPLFPPSGLLPM